MHLLLRSVRYTEEQAGVHIFLQAALQDTNRIQISYILLKCDCLLKIPLQIPYVALIGVRNSYSSVKIDYKM